jgi:hypothetical protein
MESSITYTRLLEIGVSFKELAHKYTSCYNVIGSIVFAMSTHTSAQFLDATVEHGTLEAIHNVVDE